jgi:hypothetical protein
MAVITRIHLPKSNRIHFDIKKGRTTVRPFFMHITVVIYVDLITHPLLL